MEGMDANVTSTNIQVAGNEAVTSTDAHIKSVVDGKLNSLERVEKLLKFSVIFITENQSSRLFFLFSSVI